MATPQTAPTKTGNAAVAIVAATAVTHGRKKKGDGPVTVSFIDSENKSFKRVPAGVHSVVVADRHNKVKQYSMSAIPPTVVMQLAADALKKRLDAHGRNSANDKGDNVIENTDKLFEAIKKGKIYLKGEGKGSPGKKFDFDLWIDTMVLATDLMNLKNPKQKLMTAKNKEAMRIVLEAKTPTERTEQVKKWKSNSIFSLAYARIKAKREEEAAAKSGDGDFSVLADAY